MKTVTVSVTDPAGRTTRKTVRADQTRGTWGLNPCTRVERPKKGKGSYDRNKFKSAAW